MKEILELRVEEEEARKVFRPDEGVLLSVGDVRKVSLALPDERIALIAERQREQRKKGQFFFYGWDIHRRYTKKELQAAELFQLYPRAFFEQAGEEFGTVYDESTTCSLCGAGGRQMSELVLDLQRIPKKADLATSIADEVVVSNRLAEAMQAQGVTGAAFRPVRQAGKKGTVSTAWYQLVVTSHPVDVASRTVTGDDPFNLDERNAYRCPKGHIAGLNLLSELYVSRSSYGGSDLTCTRQMFGIRRGMIRPRPFMLISPKLYALLTEFPVKRLKLEVAHLV